MKWNTEDWGSRVIATSDAVDLRIAKKDQAGILLGTNGETMKVIKQDTTTATNYHYSFWRRIEHDG